MPSLFEITALILSLCTLACSTEQRTSSTHPDSNSRFTPKPSEPPSEIIMDSEKPTHSGTKSALTDDLHKLISEMSDKIQSLETKLSSINDKMDAQKFNLALLTHPNQGKATPLADIPSENIGTPVEQIVPIPHDPEAGFTLDAPVQTFRKALIIFQGLKYPEATLAFTDFLEKYPDHAMAGAAQFYIAEAYTKQKEYKLALQEYQKILTTYDRSSHISDTLKQMAIAEDILKRTEDAARHRQLLTSLFPLSPPAASLEVAIRSDHEAENKPKNEIATPAIKKVEDPVEAPSHPSAPVDSPRHPSQSVPPTAPLDDEIGIPSIDQNPHQKPNGK